MLKGLSSNVRLSIALLVALLNTSAWSIDSFPHCATDDAKCVGEVVLQQIRLYGSNSNSTERTTFCVCEFPSNRDYCRVGQTYNYFKVLKLKRLSDGSAISDLEEFWSCKDGITPEEECKKAILTHPSCR